MLFFPAPSPELVKLYETRRLTAMLRYREEATLDVDGLMIRPSPGESKSALTFRMRVVVTSEAYRRAQQERFRMERYAKFCDEDGIINNAREVDGEIHIYAPDALGYPTHVLTENNEDS